jgi:hypothetical protein
VSTATLSFWHCYDFSSPFEVGQLGISTNSSTPPASIPTYVDYGGDTSTDWTYETVDLTPYVGQTIQVVWYYQGVTIGDPLKGWLVDDVGITGTALGAGGTITISKNLSQGTFTLTGLINRSGTGLLNTISNAPPGDYTVDFTDVTFYQTPAEVSRTLSAGGTIKFTGNYSFIDANRNGISDAWERFYFGSATTNRTQVTDTDADGMPDYAEFIAGTNPTNAASKLIMLGTTFLSNRVVRIDWAAIPGRAYQAQTSTNPPNWTPITDWIQATGSPMSCTTTNPGTGSHLYRVQVRP